MKKYLLWALWKLIHGPSETITMGAALFFPQFSVLSLCTYGSPYQNYLVIEQNSLLTLTVIPYSFKKLLLSGRKEDRAS